MQDPAELPELTGFCMEDFEDDCVADCPLWEECMDMVIMSNQLRGTPLHTEEVEQHTTEGPDVELKCTTCMSIDKCWDIWPCSECSENETDLLGKGPFTHCYYTSREAHSHP